MRVFYFKTKQAKGQHEKTKHIQDALHFHAHGVSRFFYVLVPTTASGCSCVNQYNLSKHKRSFRKKPKAPFFFIKSLNPLKPHTMQLNATQRQLLVSISLRMASVAAPKQEKTERKTRKSKKTEIEIR